MKIPPKELWRVDLGDRVVELQARMVDRGRNMNETNLLQELQNCENLLCHWAALEVAEAMGIDLRAGSRQYPTGGRRMFMSYLAFRMQDSCDKVYWHHALEQVMGINKSDYYLLTRSTYADWIKAATLACK